MLKIGAGYGGLSWRKVRALIETRPRIGRARCMSLREKGMFSVFGRNA
jgi:hypothetical protein